MTFRETIWLLLPEFKPQVTIQFNVEGLKNILTFQLKQISWHKPRKNEILPTIRWG